MPNLKLTSKQEKFLNFLKKLNLSKNNLPKDFSKNFIKTMINKNIIKN